MKRARSLLARHSARVAYARWRARRGRILAIKWGLNPNSSSLGVDVTFLLFGAAALALATPVISALIRLRRPASTPAPGGSHGQADDQTLRKEGTPERPDAPEGRNAGAS